MPSAPSIAILRPAVPRFAAAIASRPILAALALIALVTAVRLTGTVDSDVAWQLWIGQRMLAGADLYRDIIETNPPLWFWMALPVDKAAALLNVRAEAVLIITMAGLVALSLGATGRLIDHIQPHRRALLLAYGALALLAMPWMHIGQREQIALIGAVPYSALVAARRKGKAVPLLLAVIVGIGGALGFALKHYFLIVPAMLELWLVTGVRRGWKAIRPETIALVAVGAAYLAALLLFERDFLTDIVPLIRLAYGLFGAPSLRYLFGPSAIIGLVILFFLIAHPSQLAKAPFPCALAIAALGFALAYFIQSKGWPYHAIPLIGCASLGVAALLAETDVAPKLLRLLSPALLIMPFALSAQEQMRPGLPGPDLMNAVSNLHQGDTIGFITTETAVPWSVTLQGRYRYASRYNGFWMMEAILRNERLGSPDPRLALLGRQIVSQTVLDFTCTPPKRIIVPRPRAGEDSFDILPFFLRDPRFAALLSHYRVLNRTSLETYELVAPLPAPTAGCRRGV
jgi:hypothetical protein